MIKKWRTPTNRAVRAHRIGPMVSSAHLVSEKSAGLSEIDFGPIIAGYSFQRWIVHCIAASGRRPTAPFRASTIRLPAPPLRCNIPNEIGNMKP